ncbi:hypothetical protein ASG42_23305 [Rhizobium sp. Leaf391]|uniref:hypothetical protein n=1 Tax=Rhizobium sp. Leaf391 TaxID=1736360 RepID=UPI0007135FAE|nr:hypothetical protein [Rhizobium sp. Leaf391]KQT04580.1 hypothetical protein ASG42_23305 [Rhizobium sp. Leaf391]
MTNPAQLTKFIRFHLNEMAAQNAHHEFEHMARQIAKLRLYSNILPATGPVSAGGDGGRDFETYRTNVKLAPTTRSAFALLSSGEKIVVFPCSLQKNIEPKVRADLDLIAADDGVGEICYFCEANLPIAKRRKLIAEAKAKAIMLQIFDGNAIAEFLADPELFWIAQEFLHIPAELAPELPTDEGYPGRKTAWKTRNVLPVSRADFVSVKAGLRCSTFERFARPDLQFWQEKMAGFLVREAPRGIVRDAIYEIVVAQLRGRDEMTSKTIDLKDFFSDVDVHLGAGQLDDAVTLLTYAFGAFWRGVFEVDPLFLFSQREKLTELLDRELEAAPGPGRRAGLLNAYARLELLPSCSGDLVDHLNAVKRWDAMLDNAAAAPLFPIDEYCDFLGTMLKSLGDDKELLRLSDRADELLSERAGKAAAGRKSMDRAQTLLEQGNILSGIKELHKAKAKWFSGERLHDALDVLLLLSEQYRGLGLAYAAKYYAMAARAIALEEPRKNLNWVLASAIFDIVEADSCAGNAFTCLQLFPILIADHVQHDNRPFDLEQHPRLQDAIGQLAALLGVLRLRDPDTRAALDASISEWPHYLRDWLLTNADNPDGFWQMESPETGWTSMQGAFLDRPFGDLGKSRLVNWEASGIRWHCRFENTYQVTAVAEQLIAEFQLIAAALADKDLGIAVSDVNVEIAVSADHSKISVLCVEPSAGEFCVVLPASDHGPEQIAEVGAAFGTILYGCSVLADNELMKGFDVAALEASFVGRPYAELYRNLMPEDTFAAQLRAENRPLDSERQFRSSAECFLPWFSGPGPNYDEERAITDIGLRYSRLIPGVRYTLTNLVSDQSSYQRLLRLREEGLQDWEILSIVSNIAINARLSERGSQSSKEWKAHAQTMMERPESPAEALDSGSFTDELFSTYAHVYHGAFLNSWQLRYPECARPAAIEKFLVKRYRLRDLDVEHVNIFQWDYGIGHADH